MREIDLIIDENESQVIEWKASWQDKYLEWICGYCTRWNFVHWYR